MSAPCGPPPWPRPMAGRFPILIGRPEVIERRAASFGLHLKAGTDIEVINPESDPRYLDYVNTLVEIAGRQGVPLNAARTLVRTNSTVIAALAIKRGDADAMICGLEGRFYNHLDHIRRIIGMGPRTRDFAAISGCILDRGVYFFADTYGNVDRSPADMAQLTRRVSGIIKRFGVEPKVALLANSSFGSAESPEIQLDARHRRLCCMSKAPTSSLTARCTATRP